jgi:hypothetical protein
MAATTELSTPPDMATATRVSDAGLAKPKEFRPLAAAVVISAISNQGISRAGHAGSRGAGIVFLTMRTG